MNIKTKKTQLIFNLPGQFKFIRLFLLIAIALMFSLGCNVKVKTFFNSEYLIDKKVKFLIVWNAAYAYSFAIPNNFLEQIDSIGQADSIVFYTKERDAKLIYFIEGNVEKEDISHNYIFDYYQKIVKGQHLFAPNCKLIKGQYEKFYHGGGFTILGQFNNKEFIWKTELSEVPVSGDYSYKTMLFIYPIEKISYYQPLGISLAENYRSLFNP